MSMPTLPLISPRSSIREAIEMIDRSECAIALVTDLENHLLGTLTDGDIRRAMLAGTKLDQPVQLLLDAKRGTPAETPVSVPEGTPDDEMRLLMEERFIRQLPILDRQKRVVDLVLLDHLLPAAVLPIQAVIMAGGFGTRLRPLTDDTPKPMLHVGDRPLIEPVVERLREAGIRDVNISTFFRSEKIIAHFGDGAAFGVDVNYVTEERPLGTAGALGLLRNVDSPTLVTNGDIFTDVNYRSMWDFHRKQRALLTVAVRRYDLKVPYGVVVHSGTSVTGLTEKPTYEFFVNAGIYLLEPEALALIPRDMIEGRQFHMTDLIQKLLDSGQKVTSFPVHEYWLDIGQMDDYEQAQQDHQQGRAGRRAA